MGSRESGVGSQETEDRECQYPGVEGQDQLLTLDLDRLLTPDSRLPTSLRLRLPHPLVLLVACVFVAAALTYVLPAGEFERRADQATGRERGRARHLRPWSPPAPVSAFQALVAIPKGMADAADVIFYVFLVGGAFAVVDATGALRRVVDWLIRGLAGHETLVIPVACLAFGLGGI